MSRWKRLSLAASAALLVGLSVPANGSPPLGSWAFTDIGPLSTPGFIHVDGSGLWTVHAAGGDISAGADSFFFVYQPLAGDGSIAATFVAQQGDPDLSVAGITLREDDSPGARSVSLGLTPAHGLRIAVRSAAGQDLASQGGDGRFGPSQLPLSLRWQRQGDQFTPFVSYDGGLGWAQARSPISLAGFAANALAGISVAANKLGTPAAAGVSAAAVAPGVVSPIVQVCSGPTGALLSWPPVTNAVGYMVRRGGTGDPVNDTVVLTPTPIQETSFAESGLVSGKAVRYLVSAVFNQGGRLVEGYATAASATPTASPANLSSCDINVENTLLRGALGYDAATGLYTLAGAGDNIGGTADRVSFAWQRVTGDFFLTVRFPGGPTADGSKIGLMIRESLDGPSRMLALVRTGSSGTVMQWRDEAGADAGSARARILAQDYTGPLYLNLVRRGNVIIPLYSSDGKRFSYAADPKRFSVPLADTLYVGLAITSPNPAAITSSTFDDLRTGTIP
jgi:hypothetical protein